MSRDYIPRGLRDLVARTARHRCGYCLTQEAVVGTPMVIDHIVPQSLGGPTEEANLWLACPLAMLTRVIGSLSWMRIPVR
jgi:5-methylcytosine-specific restriction endonuclease McrA